MAGVASYLNFDGTCEEAFEFYRAAFGVELDAPVTYMRDAPTPPGAPSLPEEEGGRVMHESMTILGGHQLMGSDIVPSMGQVLTPGNSMYITVTLDGEDEVRELFAALSEGGTVSVEPQAMFWGDFYCDFIDRYGIQWMILAPAEEGTGLA